MKIIALCGSLRKGSSNAAMLLLVTRLAPAPMEVVLYEGIGGLPQFNPDFDDDPGAAVQEFRALMRSADGVVISSPEYAHGIPGSLKNALDWIVGTGELMAKPLLLINAAPYGGQYAQAALIEVLSAMDAVVLRDASLTAPFVKKKLAADGQTDDAAVIEMLTRSLAALAAAAG